MLLLQAHKGFLGIDIGLGGGAQLLFHKVVSRGKVTVAARLLYCCIDFQRLATVLCNAFQRLLRLLGTSGFCHLLLQGIDALNTLGHQLALLNNQVFLAGDGRNDGTVNAGLGEVAPLTRQSGSGLSAVYVVGNGGVDIVQIHQATGVHH